MIFKLGTKFGDYTVAVEGDNPMDCIEALTFLADSPRECPVCQCALTLYARRAGEKQEFRYYGLRCTNEGNGGLDAHEKTFGQFADDSGLFYKHREDWVRIGDVRGGKREDDQRGKDDRRPQQGRDNGNRGAQQGYQRPPQGRPQAQARGGSSRSEFEG